MPRGKPTPPCDLPFEHYALLFGDEPSGPDLLSMYRDLYQASKAAVDRFIAANPGRLDLHANDDGDLPISYNFAMTTTGMVMMPRRSEGTILRRNDGSEIGFVALNGTTLGGTMMVKHQEEYDALRKKPELLDTVLTAIGIPKELPSSRPHV
jgi:ATP adenylyltransferase